MSARPSLLVVCEGNLCRSPIAAALLAARLPHATVRSAGLAPRTGHPADPLARAVAHERGLDLDAHVAGPVTADLCRHADLILVMDRAQQRDVEARHLFTRGRVFRLGEHAIAPGGTRAGFDVPDPYRGTRADFVRCASLIAAAVDGWRPLILARWPDRPAALSPSTSS
ncbi:MULTISPECIES: low molecular weight protein-tyrosine-phosphatase [Burkholderia cepacia complex]|uniref:protein-tyrosine-phosphatase n=2 Tax=Burkholderia cepacia complex TaxID=87882 RepID=A0AAD0J1M8_9BURK|nr:MULTISPECIES: low molecular weight protein-tyrosine-phosphatase [Burkholderia cepacia complex]ACA93391.1 protein tyrosine phosphatase [Burkholderia orbicola MC0-3]AWG29459.1 protein tyrosine phosphatase [Burkholderia cenocepacia]MBR8412925.1 low molecular weight phosphotyrosine protein phosphatase [Burkholderia cenocepacia]MCA8088755.1 low molecular weight phosphotyrosine protein phosphatase [Burkholderia cenocepacia]PRE37968.1 low molecular weight phosphotyrosine protein phosphatase [Burkh